MKYIITILILLFSTTVFAESSPMNQIAASQDVGSGDKFLTSFYILVRMIGTLLGAFLVYIGIKKAVDFSKDDRNPKNFPTAAIITFLAGGLLLNLNQTMTLAVNTFIGSGNGYCFYSKGLGNYGKEVIGTNNACFNSAMQVTDKIANELSGQKKFEVTLKNIKERLRLLFTLLQVIGVIYLIKSIYMLKEAAEGSNNIGYGKIIIMIISSAIIIDLPHFIDMVINTIRDINKDL